MLNISFIKEYNTEYWLGTKVRCVSEYTEFEYNIGFHKGLKFIIILKSATCLFYRKDTLSCTDCER